MPLWMWIIFGVVITVGFVAFTGAPYVPSKRRDIRRAFSELYPLTNRDVLVDLGSGDGVVLREASKKGAKAIGFEIHPLLVLISKWLSRHDTNVQIRQANLWRSKLPNDVTVVYIFGDGRDISKMIAYVQKEVNRMNRPVSLISYAFTTADTPTKTVGVHHLYELKPLQDSVAPL